MTEMIVCGFHMEMELARELNAIGECRMCLNCDYLSDNRVICSKKGILNKPKKNCKEWIVDHR